jgi:hypothetical protein
MKKFLFPAVIILVFVACANHKEEKKTETDKPTETNFPPDSLVWVGLFAEWKKKQGEIIEGSYDTSYQIFVACATNNAQTVEREKINLLSTGNCNEDAPHHIKVMMKISKDSIRILGDHLIQIDTVNNEIIGVFRKGTEIRKVKMEEHVARDLQRRHVMGFPVKKIN